MTKGKRGREGRSREKTAGNGNHQKIWELGILPSLLLFSWQKTSPGSAGCAKSLCHSYTEITEPLAAPLPPLEILFLPTAGSRATRGAEICAAGTEIPSWRFVVPEINFSSGFICSWLKPQKSSQDVQWAGPRGADRGKQREILAPEPCPICLWDLEAKFDF